MSRTIILGDKKKSKYISIKIPGFTYTVVQSVLLFLTYGMKYKMPWWVTWFPSVVILTVIVIVLFIILIIFILAVIVRLLIS